MMCVMSVFVLVLDVCMYISRDDMRWRAREARRRGDVVLRKGATSDDEPCDERDRPVIIEVITANGGWYGWSGTRTGSCEGEA